MDRCARVDARRGVVSARATWLTRDGAAARENPHGGVGFRRSGAWRSRCCGRRAPPDCGSPAVLGDAEFGDNAPAAPALASQSARLRVGGLVDADGGGARGCRGPNRVRAIAAQLPARAWRDGQLAQWPQPAVEGAVRRGAQRHRRRAGPIVAAPEIWVLFERDLGATPRIKSLFRQRCRATASLQGTGAPGASSLGDRAAVSRTEGRARPAKAGG